MTEIPRWKVQAALKLLGMDDPDGLIQTATIGKASITVSFGVGVHVRTLAIADTVEDTRLHVLGIDPENGNAELNPVADNDVAFYTGANMYLHSGANYATGTMCPVFKRRPE